MVELVRYRSRVSDSERWRGFEFRPGDIVISTPSKCGTTWMQALCSMLVLGDARLDRPLAEVSPWLDAFLDRREDVVERLAAQEHRRFIKTHTPLDGLPFDERVHYLFVGRDPRDKWMSWEHHLANMDVERAMARVVAIADEAMLADLAAAMQGVAAGGPAVQLTAAGPAERFRRFTDQPASDDATSENLEHMAHHARTFWERRHLPNVTMFHYADLLADLPGEIRRLAGALDIHVDDATVERFAQEATFTSMKERAEQLAPNTDHALWRDTSSFFHRGTSGQWSELLSDSDVAHYRARLSELTGDDGLARWLEQGGPV